MTTNNASIKQYNLASMPNLQSFTWTDMNLHKEFQDLFDLVVPTKIKQVSISVRKVLFTDKTEDHEICSQFDFKVRKRTVGNNTQQKYLTLEMPETIQRGTETIKLLAPAQMSPEIAFQAQLKIKNEDSSLSDRLITIRSKLYTILSD